MTRRIKVTVALAAVAVAAILLAGTSYAMGLYGHAGQLPAQASGCGGVAMDDMHSTMWNSLASGLGLTSEELTEALSGGQTLLEIANEKGIDEEQLAARMLDAMKAAFDQQVTGGSLTPEQAEAMLETAREHMTPDHVASMAGASGPMSGPSHMGGWAGGIDMDAMHDSMHGTGEPAGGSCHGDQPGGTNDPGPNMMSRVF